MFLNFLRTSGAVGSSASCLRHALAGAAPLLLIWLWLVFTFVAVWALTGVQGWVVGSYWWDELALSGAVTALDQGLVPTVDFWAPFVLPLYLKQLAQSLVDGGRSYVLECFLQGSVVLAFFTGLVWRYRQYPGVYAAGFLAILVALVPFNVFSVTQSQFGLVSYAGGYNRLGAGLLAIVYLLPVVRLRSFPVVWFAVFFVAAYLLKITVLQAALGLVVLWLIFERDWSKFRSFLLSLLLSVLIVVSLSPFFGGGLGYLSILRELSEIRAQILADRKGFIAYYIYGDHKFELFVYIFSGLLFSLYGIIKRVDWVPAIFWYFSCLLVSLLYTLTNYGDNGLLLFFVGAYSVVVMLGAGGGGGNAAGQGELPVRIARLLHVSGCGSLGFVLVTYLLVILVYSGGSVRLGSSLSEVELGVGQNRRAYSFDAGAWSGRQNISAPGVVINLKDPKIYATYMSGVQDALIYLDESYADRDTSVYALDFPSYAFSYLAGYRVPRGSRPWMLYGHEVTLDYFPGAEDIFSDVDVLLVSKCSLAQGNRRYLSAIYRVPLERGWYKVKSLKCWDVYEPKVQ